jgi:hypothetical protein
VLFVAPVSSQQYAKKGVRLAFTGLVQTEANYGWISNAEADEERSRPCQQERTPLDTTPASLRQTMCPRTTSPCSNFNFYL